jgi:hypothetical protein
LEFDGLGDCLPPGGSQAAEFPTRLPLDDCARSFAHHIMIVGDKNP